MGNIRILNPGPLTTIQDNGRYGYQQFGVPVAGVMDSFSHRVANILVGNEENEAVLEVTMLGSQIEFMNDEVIAITGGNLTPFINGKPIHMWKSIYINTGDILSFAGIKNGCRSYIAFSGGMEVPSVMDSKSTYIKAKIGGYEGRKLKADDILKIGNPKCPKTELKNRSFPKNYIPAYEKEFEIRVVLGPQEDMFTTSGIETFLSAPYTVTNEYDRMGFRLEGKEIEHIQGGDIISDGIAFGAIQVPGHGKPIIMMADRQTTGGYSKIANVIWEDLCKVAQSKPGDILRFKQVTIKEAHELLKAFEDRMQDIKARCTVEEVLASRKFKINIMGKTHEVLVDEIR